MFDFFTFRKKRIRSVEEIGLESVSEGFADERFATAEELIDFLDHKTPPLIRTLYQKIIRKA
jgi:hypothetical protein